jgi:hypothetical protein
MGADLDRLKRYFSEARQLTQDARAQSLRCVDYFDSDQYTAPERAKLEERGQPPITVNRIKPAINGIMGVTERSRSDPRAWPRNPASGDSADVATDVLRYVADFNRFKRLKQDCFWDLLVPGTMAALVGVDADLQVTISQIRWEELFADPRARRRDFKDARFIGIAKWMYADDVAALYPPKAAAIEASVQSAGGALMADASYQDRPLQGAGGEGPWIDPRQRRLMVVEIYYREGGWRRACFTAGDILEEGDSPYLDRHGRPDCPIEAMSAYVRRDNARYGPVWDMIPLQDEINKRRSKALHLLTVNRVQARSDTAAHVDAQVVRAEAARPDGVLPMGWEMAPGTVEFRGNLELLAEAKGEMERMAPNPAVLGRGGEDGSGRALLARQQAGLVELAVLFGSLEDWELRIYRQCWARVRQFWTAPAFIRVTDDDNAPKFVGFNQPIPGPGGVLGYANRLAEMDVDIEIEAQPDLGVLAQEQFSDLMGLIGRNPAWQAQVPIDVMIQLSSIPHKRSVLDMIAAARAGTDARTAQAEALQAQHLAARTGELEARAGMHQAAGFAHALNAVTEAHVAHSPLPSGEGGAQGEALGG